MLSKWQPVIFELFKPLELPDLEVNCESQIKLICTVNPNLAILQRELRIVNCNYRIWICNSRIEFAITEFGFGFRELNSWLPNWIGIEFTITEFGFAICELNSWLQNWIWFAICDCWIWICKQITNPKFGNYDPQIQIR